MNVAGVVRGVITKLPFSLLYKVDLGILTPVKLPSKKGRTPLTKVRPKFCKQGSLVELLFFGRTGQGLHRGRTALNHGGHVVEVTSADFLLVRHEGVTLVTCCKFRLLH